MLNKKLTQIIVVSIAIAAISACSTFGKKKATEAAVTDANDSAQTAGINGNADFNGQDNNEQGLAKRTYYFEFDKSEILADDRASLAANADNLVAHPDQKILIEGHTDPRGSREYNVALGERRANAVSEFLKAKGVSPSQIRVISYGAEKAAPGRTEQDYEQDRRAVLVYLQ